MPAQDRPEITYPCEWGFRIIGTAEDEIRAAVAAVVGEGEHALETSNASSGGTYVSLRLTVTVTSNEHRLSVYRQISGAACVRMVL